MKLITKTTLFSCNNILKPFYFWRLSQTRVMVRQQC